MKTTRAVYAKRIRIVRIVITPMRLKLSCSSMEFGERLSASKFPVKPSDTARRNMSAGKVSSFLKKVEAFRADKAENARKKELYDEMIDDFNEIFEED